MSAELEDILAEADARVDGKAVTEGKKPPPPERLADSVEREKALKVAKALSGAFCWGAQPEGDAYWREIYDRLEILGGG